MKNKHFSLKLLILLLATSGLWFLFLKPIFAQTTGGYDVTVSPIYLDLTANPGDTLTTKIRLRNNTTSPIPIKVGVEKLSGDLNGNVILKQDENDPTLSWIQFDNNTFVAKPLEWTDVPFTVNIPKEAAYGYYWTITFAQDESSPLAKSGVNLTGAAGVPLLLNVVKEGAKSEGKLASFTSDKGFYEYPPVAFTTKFENLGNIHIQPKGNIFIKDWLGRQVAVLDVNQTMGNILPNSARIFQNPWDDSFITVEPKMLDGQPVMDKNGKPQTALSFHWDKVLSLKIGRYTATELIVLSTPNKDVTFQKEISFWVLPWKLIGAIILIIVFAAVGFYSTLRTVWGKTLKILGLRKKETSNP